MSTETTRHSRFYHPEIDVLRFIAALAVFIHHALPQTPDRYASLLPAEIAAWFAATIYGLGFGVDLFFALSAYLITELLIREYHRAGEIDVRAFYIRRTLRIWPLYIIFLTFALVVVPVLIPGQHMSLAHRIGFTFFGANWAIALFGYPQSVASPLWSVSIEEQFYILWPLVLAYVGIRHIPRVAFVMLIIALLTRVVLVLADVTHPGIYTNTFARLDPIAAGALLAVVLKGKSLHLPRIWRMLMCLLAAVLVITVTRYSGLDGMGSLVTYPVITIASILFICAFLHNEHTVPRLLKNRLLVQLGRMSYGIYVFHVFGLTFAGAVLFPSLHGVTRLVVTTPIGLILTLLLAMASYYWIERPFLMLKERFAIVQSRPV